MKQVNVKVLIQGYVDSNITTHSQMRAVKLNQGVEGATASQCDDVTIQLLNDDVEVVASDLVTLDLQGNATATFDVPNGNYYVSVKHRNSIQVYSAEQIELSETAVTYDFTTDTSKTYGSNAVLDHNENSCMISGDINQDGQIDGLDVSILEADANNFATGYLASDLNGDGQVDGLDVSIMEGKADEFVGTRPPIRN